MKKILLATTMIAGFAGVASAQDAAMGVTTSAEARMGVIYDGDNAFFTSRVRIKFTATGETDGGLAFGAEMRADQDGGNTDGEANGDSTVYISGAFGKLSMGDVGTAADNIVGNVSGVGLTGLGDYNELGYMGNAKTAVKYEYTSGAFTGALSFGQTLVDAAGKSLDDSNLVSVAGKYSGETYNVSLGYEYGDTAKQLTVGAEFTSGPFTGKIRIADNDADEDLRYALSADYVTGATTITAFYSDNKGGNPTGADTIQAIGLGASYDLGGGASVKIGAVDLKGEKTTFDMGVSMAF